MVIVDLTLLDEHKEAVWCIRQENDIEENIYATLHNNIYTESANSLTLL